MSATRTESRFVYRYTPHGTGRLKNNIASNPEKTSIEYHVVQNALNK